MPTVDQNVLEHLGQLLKKDPHAQDTLSRWLSEAPPTTRALVLSYCLHAHRAGHTIPSLTGFSFAGCDLTETIFDGYTHPLDLSNTDFTGATLRRAHFGHVTLTGARFDTAILTQATFRDCDLSKASFTDADTTAMHIKGQVLPSEEAADATAQNATEPTFHPDIFINTMDGPRSLACTHTLASALSETSLAISTFGICAVLSASTILLVTVKRSPPSPSPPTSDLLASASDDRTARIWNVATGQCRHVLAGLDRSIASLAFHPTLPLLATASYGGEAHLWNTISGECVHTLSGHDDTVFCTSFNPSGNFLATACDDGILRLWDVQSGECLRVTVIADPGPFSIGGYAVWDPRANRMIEWAGEA